MPDLSAMLLTELKQYAKENSIRLDYGMNKPEIIERVTKDLAARERGEPTTAPKKRGRPPGQQKNPDIVEKPAETHTRKRKIIAKQAVITENTEELPDIPNTPDIQDIQEVIKIKPKRPYHRKIKPVSDSAVLSVGTDTGKSNETDKANETNEANNIDAPSNIIQPQITADAFELPTNASDITTQARETVSIIDDIALAKDTPALDQLAPAVQPEPVRLPTRELVTAKAEPTRRTWSTMNSDDSGVSQRHSPASIQRIDRSERTERSDRIGSATRQDDRFTNKVVTPVGNSHEQSQPIRRGYTILDNPKPAATAVETNRLYNRMNNIQPNQNRFTDRIGTDRINPVQTFTRVSGVSDSTVARRGYETRREVPMGSPSLPELLSSGECQDGIGILELHPDGYGFLRGDNYQSTPYDVYISIAQIRRFGLKNGDKVSGKTRPIREGERNAALLFITSINDIPADQMPRRIPFENLMPIYPDERLTLENETNKDDLAIRVIDFIAPIGKGQRALIVSPPKAGKTILLKKIANAIGANFPNAELMVLLIDERPEEVTDFKRSLNRGEVVFSTFDDAPENHTRVAELVIERAQRLVECGKDVIILLDSLTRLARAHNAAAPQSGRAMSGGLAPGVLQKPKRFFGSARKVENGGSLTIIATCLVETGSRMDDIIYEEFKGTGNMEIHLDRKLSEKRIFPAIDIAKSGTRREELLLSPAELEAEQMIRKILSTANVSDATEQLISMMAKTTSNDTFFQKLKEWVKLWDKQGYSLGGRNRNID
ncbi:hypothetical protein FACS18948_2480 [Clostridia bacterium]|nr:hypothetical protein FACS18948_2480 [Clostridia bacterium]